MISYILSVLGIVIAGVIIEVIIPSGNISKYIKSVYSIFVVAVLISPVVNFLSKKHNYKLDYNNYQLDAELMEYIFEKRVKNAETEIEMCFLDSGFKNVDIVINYSINNNEIVYNSCQVNLQNLEINEDKQHINKYEFIAEVVNSYTNLTYEEIMINE